MASPPDLPPPARARDYPPPPRTRPSPTHDPERKRLRASSPDGLSRRDYRGRSWDRDRDRDRSWDRDRAWDRDRGGDRDAHDRARRPASYAAPKRAPYPHAPAHERRAPPPYGNGAPNAAALRAPQPAPPNSKSRRLYIGNIPFQAGLTDVAITQLFSALYVAAFRPNVPGECLPVVSFWLHSDGKFGFMELRGEQEAVNMMQFNGLFLHGRPLRVNRPSDYKPELHNPAALTLVPQSVNARPVVELCNQLGGVVAPPSQLAAVAAAQDPHPEALAPQGISPPRASGYPAPLRSQTQAVTPPRGPDQDALHREQGPKPSSARVVSLRNLVTDDDLEGNDEDYQEIVADVQTECSNYGRVLSVKIPRSGPWKGTAFVEFSDEMQAKRALEALGKTVFDGRKIVAVIVHGCETAAEAASRAPPS